MRVYVCATASNPEDAHLFRDWAHHLLRLGHRGGEVESAQESCARALDKARQAARLAPKDVTVLETLADAVFMVNARRERESVDLVEEGLRACDAALELESESITLKLHRMHFLASKARLLDREDVFLLASRYAADCLRASAEWEDESHVFGDGWLEVLKSWGEHVADRNETFRREKERYAFDRRRASEIRRYLS